MNCTRLHGGCKARICVWPRKVQSVFGRSHTPTQSFKAPPCAYACTRGALMFHTVFVTPLLIWRSAVAERVSQQRTLELPAASARRPPASGQPHLRCSRARPRTRSPRRRLSTADLAPDAIAIGIVVAVAFDRRLAAGSLLHVLVGIPVALLAIALLLRSSAVCAWCRAPPCCGPCPSVATTACQAVFMDRSVRLSREPLAKRDQPRHRCRNRNLQAKHGG